MAPATKKIKAVKKGKSRRVKERVRTEASVVVKHRSVNSQRSYPTDDQRVVFASGHSRRLRPAYISRVREAVASHNTQQFTTVEKATATSTLCKYHFSPMLYQYNDVTAIAANIAGGIAQRRYTITDAELECQLTNASSGQTNMRVYECACRYDLANNGVIGKPSSYLSQGFADMAAGGLTDITGTPFQSPMFVEHFKILKVRDLKFQPGEMKTLKIIDRSPFNVYIPRYQEAGNALINGVAKRSKFLLFQQWGQMAVESGAVGTLGTAVAVTNCLYNQRYGFTWVQDYDTTVFKATGITADGTSTAQTVLVNPAILLEQTDALAVEITG